MKKMKPIRPIRKGTGCLVSDKVPNMEKQPFFIKKANEAKALISKVGLPKV